VTSSQEIRHARPEQDVYDWDEARAVGGNGTLGKWWERPEA
jgi:hypothetical protein